MAKKDPFVVSAISETRFFSRFIGGTGRHGIDKGRYPSTGIIFSSPYEKIIIGFDRWFMVVYWEYAFAENFLLDGLLLYLALKTVRMEISVWRLALSSAAGGAESILFSLVTLPAWGSYAVKILGGVLLAVIAAEKFFPKKVFAVCIAFFLYTFALGGLLTAVYTFFDVEYVEDGYFVESAPVALILAAAVIFFLVSLRALRAFYRLRREKNGVWECVLFREGAPLSKPLFWKGLADSGNLLSFRGQPVCVTSALGIFALLGAHPRTEGYITVQTVNGSRRRPVFLCRRMEILTGSARGAKRGDGAAGGCAEEVRTLKNVYFTVGEICSENYQFIIHTDCLEGNDEGFNRAENGIA